MNLIIDGIEITLQSAVELSQNYSAVNNGTIVRFSDGGGQKQVPLWSKLSTNINSTGWLPEGLSGVDFSGSVVVDCVGQRSITSGSNIIAIPGTVRPDNDPWGMAYVNGDWQKVGSSWVGGTLTIDITTDATLYQARWMPRLILFCDEPETETDNNGNVYAWSIAGQEE